MTLLSTQASLAGLAGALCRRMAGAGKVVYNCLVSGPGRPTLSHAVLCLCPQAADLVSENCETYEAHMRDIRDYLEERLEVRGRKDTPRRHPRMGQCRQHGGARHYLSVDETQSGDLGKERAGLGWKLAGIRNPQREPCIFLRHVVVCER